VSLQPQDPFVRASDADRDAVAGLLRDAHAEGRLTVEEFTERLDAAYAARTHGDLVPLTSDLPASTGTDRRRPRTGDEAAPTRRRDSGDGHPDRLDRGLRAAWGVWGAAVLVNVVIWALVSISNADLVYFWPVWVAGPWGAVLLAGTIFGRGGHR
jgi:hypothetical protein